MRLLTGRTGAVTAVLPAATIGAVVDAFRQADGTYFVASFDLGLLRFGPGNTSKPELLKPNAPATEQTFGLTADTHANAVVVFPGGYQDNTVGLGRSGFYEYQAGRWTNYTADNYPSPADYPNLTDQSHGAFTPDGTLYVASYGNGLLQWQGVGKFRQFTAGSPPTLRRCSAP